jgi:phosphoenolpyruvate carboxykinase (ATP)
MSLPLTRAMLHAALEGLLNDVPYATDPVFGVQVPQTCPDVPDAVLQPRLSWSDSAAYDAAARRLAEMFRAEWLKYTV